MVGINIDLDFSEKEMKLLKEACLRKEVSFSSFSRDALLTEAAFVVADDPFFDRGDDQ